MISPEESSYYYSCHLLEADLGDTDISPNRAHGALFVKAYTLISQEILYPSSACSCRILGKRSVLILRVYEISSILVIR